MAKHLRPRRLARRPSLEPLESRKLLAAFVVNSTADTDTAGTLRFALSNLTPGGPNTISFNLPASSVIQPASALPAITAPVTIDATNGGTVPLVTLDGTAAGGGTNGLTVNVAGVTIKGLAIGHFGGSGIVLNGVGNDTVGACYVGTDLTGKTAAANAGSGIVVNSSNNIIGGSAGTNVLSGNANSGLVINGTATSGKSNLVSNALIGVDSTGAKGLANRVGVTVTNGTGNVFAGDVVSANTAGGIIFNGGGTNNVVQGTVVGTDTTGEVKLGNGAFGIQVSGDTGDRIGFVGFGNLNIVSNNAGAGIDITGSHNVTVTNTFVGLDRAGSANFGNTGDGVVVENSSTGTTIGGTTPSLGNFIAGNGNNGVDVETGSTGTTIQTNHVGSDVTGLIGIPNTQNGFQFNQTSGTVLSNSILDNGQSGVLLFGGSGSLLRSNYIGDIATGTHGNAVDGVFLYGSNGNTIAGNVISSNGQYGVTIQNGSRNNLVAANYVGLNGAGQPGRGNQNGIAVFDSPGTTIGGGAGSGNVIGTNQQYGIDIHGTDSTGTLIAGNIVGATPDGASKAPNSSGIILDGAAGVVIRNNIVSGNTVDGIYILGGGGSIIAANLIGTDGSGTKQLGNGADGVDISGSRNNTVGGSTSAGTNVIGANNGFGVQIHDAGATGNVVSGDWIGVDISGLKALGNGEAGVFVQNVPGNTVGGASGAFNVIGFNSNEGIFVAGPAATGTLIANNYVGVGADGVTAAPNTVDGIVVQGTRGVDIAYNVVSENASFGIHLTGGASGTTIRGNLIGTDITGTLARGNAVSGILLDGSNGNVIGGTAGAGTRNVISGNGVSGVFVYGTSTSNFIQGNYIGTNSSGRGALGNAVDGVLLQAAGNVVGGNSAATNLISGNGSSGVHVIGGGTGNVVSGNWIGTDSSGLHPLGNSFYGVFVDGTGVGSVANNVIGATATGTGNVIVGSGVVNVNIAGTGATRTRVQGNYIGTSVTGALGLFPTPYGIFINGSAGNVIGGTSAGLGNLIDASVSAGLAISNAGASGNLVVGNIIGRGSNGGPSLANNLGVLINNAPNNTIGGAASGAANVISGNTTNTIQVTGAGATGDQTTGNVIGP